MRYHVGFMAAIVCVMAGRTACGQEVADSEDGSRRIRVATYNVSLYAESPGEVARRLTAGDDLQASRLASIIRTVRPDVLLINEIDYDEQGQLLSVFAEKYLEPARLERITDPRHVSPAINYPYRMAMRSNTGVGSGMDLNNDGDTDDPEDAYGFGRYPGQYALAILSRYPIDVDAVRRFQKYRWSDLPDARRPKADGGSFYSDEIWRALRLSSKNHVDVPIRVGERSLHVLASHPTPPVFDGPEDRNGCRNADEIRFWSLYLDDSAEIVDDAGVPGGLDDGESFVVMGDLNSDPKRGDSQQDAITALLNHRRVIDPQPSGDRGLATAAFGGGMRVDYVLPGAVKPVGSGVFDAADDARVKATDHRLVWVDLELAAE